MPLEILVDTGKKRGVMRIDNLKAIDEFEQYLASHKDISKAVSVVSFIKASRSLPAWHSIPARLATRAMVPPSGRVDKYTMQSYTGTAAGRSASSTSSGTRSVPSGFRVVSPPVGKAESI